MDEAVQAQYDRVKESYDRTIAQAGKLAEAGVPFAFSTIDAKPSDAMKSLRAMIEAGLTESAAMAALTTNAASMIGMNRIAGTVEQGKLANLVITTGPIFSEDSQIKHVVADGSIFDYEIKTKMKNGNGEATVEVAGTWDYTSETPAGSSGGKLTIEKDGDDYSGTITYDDPSGNGTATSPISDVSISGSQLSFSF